MMFKAKTEKKGFTLIELLVVIAILAVLATAVVIILNPAELVKQGRDSTRLSDLAALHSALALYLSDVATASLGSCSGTAARCTAAGTSPMSPRSTCTVSSSTAVNGTGWVDVNFNQVDSGSPLAREPIDPVNNTTYFYSYGCDNTAKTYELDAIMESQKYSTGGGGDVESNSKDGGSNNAAYEIGNAPGLAL